MRRRLAALVVGLTQAVAACTSEPAPPDMKDPLSVARAFVAAYNAQDLSRMAPLVDQVNMDAIREALAGGPDSEAWHGIFAPTMVDILAREAGRVEGPRYDGRDAVVKIGASENGDIYAIELAQRDDDRWFIAETSTLDAGEFERLPTEPRKRR